MSILDLSGRPLRDTERDRALFVDREEILTAVRQTLRSHGNVLVLGSKGSGKSSLLRYLKHLLEAEDERVVFIDGRAATSAAEFLALLRDRLQAWHQVGLEDVAGAVAGSLNSFAADPRLVLRPQQGETQLLLSELRNFRSTLPNEETIVLVDESPSPEVAHTLFGRLRDELWELPLTWCVSADERERGSYTAPPADAFWQRVLTVPPLTEQESVELLERRLPANALPAEALEQIAEEAGGNPRALLSLAHEVAVEGRDPRQLITQRRRRERQLKTLSEPAQRLLAELEANGPASPSDQSLLQRLGWTRSRASQVFGELQERNLVRATTRAGTGTRPRRVFEVKR